MKVVFRVDASIQIGIGHLMRCLTLAETLRERGVQIYFVCREHPGNLIALLQQNTMPVTMLTAPTINNSMHGEDYAAWLGVTQAEDAEQTILALAGEKPDWLVVDHYGLDVEWEQRLRPYVIKLMVIDDLANRHHDCDVLLDQNYSTEGECRYAGLVPDACSLLVGTRYALLRFEYAAYRKTLSVRDREIRRVMVFFGGADPQNMTGLALEALSHPSLRHIKVDLVIGANNPHREVLEQQSRGREQTTIYGSRPHLADLMAQADLAIGAGGATTWERMCLGLPTIVITIAENQRPAANALAEAKLISYAGHFSETNTDQLTQLLSQLCCDTEKLTGMSIQNQIQVDGLGALRLAEALFPSDTSKIRLRPACEEDITLYFNWANDPEVRNNAVNTSTIPWATHRVWFANKLQDLNCHMFVLEVSGLPVGQIRFDRVGDEIYIDYSLDLIVRGRGWGQRLLDLGVKQISVVGPARLRAEVRATNAVSAAIFLRNGFTETLNAPGEYRSFYYDVGTSDERVVWL